MAMYDFNALGSQILPTIWARRILPANLTQQFTYLFHIEKAKQTTFMYYN